MKATDSELSDGYALLQKDLQGNILVTDYLGNPLVTDIEFINEKGDFERKTISQNSALVTVRIELNPLANFLVVQSRMNGLRNDLLRTDISQL